MTISAYTGLPGHGKSYGVVDNVIIPALKAKRVVYTNIPMHHEVCLHDLDMVPVPFHTDDILKNPNWFRDVFQSGSLFVLDEVWRLWPSGMKANAVRDGDKEFIAEHRHLVGENGLSTEIYLVTQDLSDIASFARNKVEHTFRMNKLSSIGATKSYRCDIYFGPVTGVKPNPKAREREIFGRFSPDIYKYYKSHTKSKTGEAGDETRVDNRFGVLKRVSLKFGILFVVLALIFIFIGSQRVYKGYHPEPKNAVKSEPAAVGDTQRKVTSSVDHVPQIAPVVNPVAVPKFLSLARRLFVGYSIGTRDAVVNYYVVSFDDYSVTMTAKDLEFLGYTLVAVSECIVKVTGYDYSGFFMCPKREQRKEGLVAGLATDFSNVAPVTN